MLHVCKTIRENGGMLQCFRTMLCAAHRTARGLRRRGETWMRMQLIEWAKRNSLDYW